MSFVIVFSLGAFCGFKSYQLSKKMGVLHELAERNYKLKNYNSLNSIALKELREAIKEQDFSEEVLSECSCLEKMNDEDISLYEDAKRHLGGAFGAYFLNTIGSEVLKKENTDKEQSPCVKEELYIPNLDDELAATDLENTNVESCKEKQIDEDISNLLDKIPKEIYPSCPFDSENSYPSSKKSKPKSLIKRK